MKYAWIENNKVRDIVDVDPYSIFHEDVAVNYNTQVEDSVENNAEMIDGVWVNPVTPVPDPNYVAPEVHKVYPKMTPVETRCCLPFKKEDLIVQFFFSGCKLRKLSYNG